MSSVLANVKEAIPLSHPVGKCLFQSVLSDSDLYGYLQYSLSDMGKGSIRLDMASGSNVTCRQRSLVHLDTPVLSLREFNWTVMESNTCGKKVSENKVKRHHLTLSNIHSLQEDIAQIESERPYGDTLLLFAG